MKLFSLLPRRLSHFACNSPVKGSPSKIRLTRKRTHHSTPNYYNTGPFSC